MCYLIYFIIDTKIDANFTGESCKLFFKTIIVKIFSKKELPNPGAAGRGVWGGAAPPQAKF